MQDELNISHRTETLRVLMDKHLGIREKTYEQAVRRSGRQLPRPVRAQALRIVKAEAMAGSPVLCRQIDVREIENAHQEVSDWLRTIDRAEVQRTRRLRWLAGTVLNLLAFAVLLILVLRWRGLL